MARSLSWIDADEWTSLIDVVRPAADPHSAVDMDTIGDSLRTIEIARREKRAQAPPADRAPEPQRATRPPAHPVTQVAMATPPPPVARPPMVRPAPARAAAPARMAAPAPAAAPHAEIKPAVPSFRPRSADVDERMSEFLVWVSRHAGMTGALIADSNGLIVAGWNTDELDAVVSGSVELLLQNLGTVLHDKEQPSRGADAVTGHVAVEHNGRHIIVIWAPTDYGRLYGVLIGHVAPAPEVLVATDDGFRALFAL